MLFIILLVISTMAVAGGAAFFSVYGLAQVFAGAFVSVAFMGASLEIGKLMAASFLYRLWDKTGLLLRSVLIAIIVILMGITSMGVSGYLTSAYQLDTVGLRATDERLEANLRERDLLEARKKEMDQQIKANTEDNYVTAAQKLMESFKPEYNSIDTRLKTVQEEITELQTSKITTETKVGPIIFISKVLGTETDDAIFWLVVLLVLVFDPLAVALTIACNIAIKDRLARKEAPTLQPVATSAPLLDPEAESVEVMGRTVSESDTVEPASIVEFTVDSIEEDSPNSVIQSLRRNASSN